MEKNKMFNLLKELNFADYESLISQVTLESQGYKLYFALDADLIGNYCYPKGIIEPKGRRVKLTQEYISDEQIALHTLFYLNNQKLLLLNQYYYEVESMLYKANKTNDKKLSESNINFPVFKITGEGTNALVDLFYDSFSEMYAKVLLHVNGLKKATNLFDQKRLILDSEEIADDDIRETLNFCHGTESQTKTINTIIKSSIEKLYKINEENLLTSSKKRDAIVIDRIISFNERIQNSEEKNKIFILLSDDPIITATFYRLKRLKKSIKYPLISKKKISFCRSIPQTFAYLICIDYKSQNQIDYDKTISNLKNLQRVSKSVNDRFNVASDKLELNTDEILRTDIFANYNKLRNAFENSGLLKSFDILYDSIKEDLKGKNLEDVAKLFVSLKNEGVNLQKEIESKHLYFLRKLNKDAAFNTSFLFGLDQIRKHNATFDLSKGVDFVEGNYQHLPLFLTFSNDQNGYINHVYDLIKLVLSNEAENSKHICSQLESILDDMASSKIEDETKIEINLIKAFIFMILPSIKTNGSIKENDKMAFEWLKELEISDDNEEAKKNQLYLKIWSLRRVKRYNESLKLSKRSIKSYPEDPRFFHGHFLSQYCIFETMNENTDNKKTINLIDKMIESLNKSNELYFDFIIANYKNQNILPQLNEAITNTYNNSFSYCIALKAGLVLKNESYSEFNSLIKKSRTYFKKLKYENNELVENLPEYYDTEAYIEYLESFCESENKLSKIKFAFKAISKAIKLSKNETLILKYKKRQTLIEQRRQQLQ